jgi:hypothetical protein
MGGRKDTDPASISRDRPLDFSGKPMVNSASMQEAQTSSIDADFHAWLVEQTALVRARQYQRIDWEHVAEELEDMGAGVRHALRSDLEIVLQHLLKLQYEPSPNEWRGRARGWKLHAAEHRNRLIDILDDSPSLRNSIPEVIAKAYSRAVEQASIDIGRPEADFPGDCPWSLQEILKMLSPNRSA